ncbi:hypothetical protein T08_12182 [Trichinella sp. T8]|nr:hypothetical protein T08_12182 [Trichinella sp. T8]
MNVEICQLPPNKEGNITNKEHIDEDDLMKVELTDVCGELVNVNELETVMKLMLTNMTRKLKKKLLRNFTKGKREIHL